MKQGDEKRAIEKVRLFHAPGPCSQTSLTNPICLALQQPSNVISFLIIHQINLTLPVVYIETAESTLVKDVNSTACRRWAPADDR